MSDLEIIVALVAIVVLAIGCEVVADKVGMPQILVLLAVGFASGVPSWGLDPDAVLGDLLFPFVSIAVAVILFEGGLNLELSRLRREQRAIRRLVTWGAVVTLLGGAAAVAVWFDTGWRPALLYGGLVVVTMFAWPFIDAQIRKRTRFQEASVWIGIAGVLAIVGLTVWEAVVRH